MEQELPIPEKKPAGPVKKIFRLFFWLIIIFILFVVSAVALVFIYEEEVKAAVIDELNKNLKSEVKVDPKNIDLTFIKTFPECAIQFKDVLILEATAKKQRDTLIFAGDIYLLFSLKDIWNKNYTINNIKIDKASCNLKVDKNGQPNYIFWKKIETGGNEKVNFKLNKIDLSEIRLTYRNSKKKLKFSIDFANTEFTGDFDEKDFSMEAKGNAAIGYLTLNKNQLIRNKKLKYDLGFRVSGPDYTITKSELALNDIYFSLDGDIKYSDSLQIAKVNFTGKNLDIASVLSLLPEKESQRISDYESEGDFYCKGKIDYKAGSDVNVDADFGIKNATVIYIPNKVKLNSLSIEGKLVSNENESYLNIRTVNAAMGNNTLNGFCNIRNLNDPYIDVSAEVKSNLQELNSFWPIDTIEQISGDVNLKAILKGKVSDIKKSALSQDVIMQGNATLNAVKTKFKGNPKEIIIEKGIFEMANRGVTVSGFKMLFGKSDVELNGTLPDFFNYLTDNTAPLIIEANVKSGNVLLEDFLFAESGTNEKKINIPGNLRFKLTASMDNLSFSKFSASNIRGEVVVQDKKIYINDLLLNTMDGKAQISALADAGGEKISIKAASELQNINISKLFYQCNNFGQNTLNEKHLNGYATANINFSGNWSNTLNANLTSIKAAGNITVDQGRLVDFKPLLSLSKYVEVNELKDIKFQTLQSNFEIADQVISIPKTSIKNSAMNLELWGKHTFKNEIDYHIKLLLSELLANKKRGNKQLDEELMVEENDPENRRCVFLLMTGTVDNPVIKYDRKGMKQKISEDLKAEKQTIKQLLKEEFGLFKKDSTLKDHNKEKAENKFKIEFGEKQEKKSQGLQPKKKEDDDDDF